LQELLGTQIESPCVLYTTEEEKYSEKVFDVSLLDQWLRYEKKAPSIYVPKEEDEQEPQQEPVHLEKQAVSSTYTKARLVTLLVSTAALVLLVLWANFMPPNVEMQVATISDTIAAEWGTIEGRVVKKGDRLSTGSESINLKKGYAKLLFDNKTQVAIEAPAEFKILTDKKIKLNYGKLYAIVPEEAYGFTVSTDYSRFVDLGTEFGVKADQSGNSELHVFKGKVNLISHLKSGNINVEVDEDSAKRLSQKTGEMDDISTDTKLFVKDISSEHSIILRGQASIDLADIVGGGNGFGQGKMGYAIDQLSGKITKEKMIDNRTVTEKFTMVEDSPFIEGVFVPNGENGPVVVSSQGHQFDQCPNTNGWYWGGIFNGAQHEAEQFEIPRHALRLGSSIYYGKDNPSSIYIHANQGITFDLDAIRQIVPNKLIYRFTSKCGISNTLENYKDKLSAWSSRSNQWTKLTPDSTNADFYVLVDGEVRFSKVDVTMSDGAIDIFIEIFPEDRFLTLVSTQGSDEWGNANDWTLFAEPRLLFNH
jgi:hypothetical protein